MQQKQAIVGKSWTHELYIYVIIAIGAFFAAFSIEVFLIPHRLIDGGIVGLAMIIGNLTHKKFIPYALMILNLPFLYLAWRSIGKVFLIHFLYAVLMFGASLIFLHHFLPWQFDGESLEVVVIGGAILGIGLGMIIRYGGCVDGTEILGIILSRRAGFSVGQVVFVCNIFIFGAAGIVFQDWHPPLLSLIMYMVVIKVMDAVIVGLDETKSVMVVSIKSKEISESIMHELGLGLTIMYGRGGFSGEEKEILYVIAERLQLAELKELIHRIDPAAFIAIENLHEVAYGKENLTNGRKNQLKKISKLVKNLVFQQSEPKN
jgi:uncharacterized membrane-anchored protein YitT (DUF2179 family)